MRDAALLRRLGMTIPLVQAPMAGVSTPALAAAVANAGALGSLGIGALDVVAAQAQIAQTRALSSRAINVNVFCHRPARRDAALEAAWIARLAPHFARFGAEPPRALRENYGTFLDDEAMLAMLLRERPQVVSFHFGLPAAATIAALRAAGIVLIASATNLAEARAVEAAGIDAVVAQGIEAGGHRGTFEPEAADEGLGVMTLTRQLVRALRIPVIAAGGIMDGAGIAAALALGAVAAQLGTAFIACPESMADASFRAALQAEDVRTRLTRAISGRVARSLCNELAALDEDLAPDYPVAYDAAKALGAAAKACGVAGWAAQLAGQGAPLVRVLGAGELVRVLADEAGP